MDGLTVGEIGLCVEHKRGTARMPESHRHAEVEVNCIVSGRLSYWLGGGLVTLEPGSLSAFWAAYPHRVVADADDLEFYWLTVPLPAFLQWGFPRSLIDALMRGTLVRQTEGLHMEAEIPLWNRWVETCKSPRTTGFPLEVLRWEVRARLGRFALEAAPIDHGHGHRNPGGMSEGVQRMARFIGEHFNEPVKVADIAASAELNPNYATEAFRKVFGLGIKDYLNRQRIAEAQRLLLSTDLTVLEIGYQSGFASPSRFHEWFRRLCEQSPEAYRTLHASRFS